MPHLPDRSSGPGSSSSGCRRFDTGAARASFLPQGNPRPGSPGRWRFTPQTCGSAPRPGSRRDSCRCWTACPAGHAVRRARESATQSPPLSIPMPNKRPVSQAAIRSRVAASISTASSISEAFDCSCSDPDRHPPQEQSMSAGPVQFTTVISTVPRCEERYSTRSPGCRKWPDSNSFSRKVSITLGTNRSPRSQPPDRR